MSDENNTEKQGLSNTKRVLIAISIFIVIIALVISGYYLSQIKGIDLFGLKESSEVIKSSNFDGESTTKSEKINYTNNNDSANEDANEIVNLTAYVIPSVGLHLRTLPTKNSTSQLIMQKNERLTVFYFRGNWAYVKYKQLYGFCHRDYISIDSEVIYPSDVNCSESATPSTNKDLKLYCTKSTDSRSINTVKPGNVVIVLFYDGDWAFVRYNSYHGWCAKKELTVNGNVADEEIETGQVAVNGGATLFSSCDNSSSVLGSVSQQTMVIIIEIKNGYYHVIANGLDGWCPVDAVRQNDNSTTEQTTISNKDTFTKQEIESAIEDSNKVIRSYCGKLTNGAKTTVDENSVVELYKEAQKLAGYQTEYDLYFDRILGMVICSDDKCNFNYSFVEDSTVKTLDDVCDLYFSLFSDEKALDYLLNNFFEIDGRLVASSGAFGTGVPEVTFSYTVQKNGENYDIHVSGVYPPESKDFSPGDYNGVSTCRFEDGAWVFDDVYWN